MLRQEMQAKEDLAARTAEVEDLKARVAELEKLQQQQQQLISLKDSELAAAQQRLAGTREAGTVATPAQEQSSSSATPWLWGGAGLTGLALFRAVRQGAYASWLGWTSLVLGGLTALFMVSPLQYMAGMTGPVWLVVVSLGLLRTAREA